MRGITKKIRVGLLVLALMGLAGVTPAAAGGGPVDHQYIAVGTTDAGPASCVDIGGGLLQCENVRSGNLLGLPFWLATWSGTNTSVTDTNSPCVDFQGRQGFAVTGTTDFVMSSGGSDLFAHRSYFGCWLESVGGYNIGTLTFTGGTGAFAGASGSATIVVAHDPAGPDLTLAVGTLTI